MTLGARVLSKHLGNCILGLLEHPHGYRGVIEVTEEEL